MKLLVTGFGPFAAAEDNASEHLARELGPPFEIFEVAYEAVEQRLREIAAHPPDAMLPMGVDPNGARMRLETVAHNRIGEKPDVRGQVWGPGPLDPLAPPQLSATLWTPAVLAETERTEPGSDAGGYLCNFSFFRAAQWLPQSRVGFIHVAPFSAVAKETQLSELETILDSCGFALALR